MVSGNTNMQNKRPTTQHPLNMKKVLEVPMVSSKIGQNLLTKNMSMQLTPVVMEAIDP